MSHEVHPNPNKHDDPTAAPVIVAGLAGSLVVVAAVIALVALTHRTESKLERELVYDAPSIKVEQLHAEQEADLHTPRWIDKENGIVSIPINDAIKLVSRELATSPDGTGPWSPRPRKAAELPAAEESGGEPVPEAP